LAIGMHVVRTKANEPAGSYDLALTALQGPLMEWYTSIINLTVAAVLLVILVASRRWRDE
jgi:hypothetical protein